MTEHTFFDGLIIAWFILAAAIFVTLFFISAPYGRHARRGWGPAVPGWAGWLIMEAPAALLFAAFFVIGKNNGSLLAWVFVAMWEAHYLHRAFIYPVSLAGRGRPMPVSVVAMGFFFNGVNGYLNGRYLFTLSGGYPVSWLRDPRFLVGLALFVAGYAINRWADHHLAGLRRPGEKGYCIPHGGLYRWISCPNYFGEIVEWFGWAMATWSLAGLVFALWTMANLAPRARANHQWYRAYFAGYPPERKALLPGVW